MTDAPYNELHQELKTHAGALRGLARDLLRDTHAAEDVTQQTLAKAWAARKQLEPGPMGGWLQRVLTNFTRQWRRGERRKTSREAHYARQFLEAHQASPAETLVRREALQAVTNAVLQLAEPYQTAVFLRYFEDLPPRAIAQRTHTNVATVKSRIARGLVMLRAQLAQSRGEHDWRLALANTLGLPLSSVLTPLTTGILLMKASLKITLATAALCIGGLYLYRVADPTPPTTGTLETNVKASIAASSVPSSGDTPVADREEVIAPKGAEALLSHPYTLELMVHVLDEHGLPLAGFRPQLAPTSGSLRDAETETDATGTMLIRWMARRPVVSIDLLDPRRHRRQIEVRHGQTTHVAIVANRYTEFTFRVGDLSGVEVISSLSSQLVMNNFASAKLGVGLHPYAVFSETGLVPVAADQPTVTASERAVSVGDTFQVKKANFRADGGTLQLSQMQVNRAAAPKPEHNCSVEGFVYGEDGKAKPDIPIALMGSSPQPLHHTKTDAHGAFRFADLAANDYQVRAGGTSQGLASLPVRVDKGNYTVALNLRREACIRGTLHDQADEPVANATIEWFSANGSWADRTTTESDGSFLLANLPSTSGQLFAWHEDRSCRFPVAHSDQVAPDSSPVAMRCELADTGTIRAQPTAYPECDLKDLQLRVRQVATGFSHDVQVPRIATTVTNNNGKERTRQVRNPDAAWELPSLPAGFYEVEMWLPGCGSKNLGQHWVDGKAVTELGNVALPLPGVLRFEVPTSELPADLSVEITAVRDSFDVRIEKLQSLADHVLLPAGIYLVATRRGEQPPQFRRLAVESGKTTTMPLTW